MADECQTPDYDEGPCHCDFCDPGRLRDGRVETIYQVCGAREMAERIVDLEDELGADVDGICTGMHADVAEAQAEIGRLRGVVLDVETVGLQWMRQARRFEAAWTSARRRATTVMGAWRYVQWRIDAQSTEMREQDNYARWLWGCLSERRQERDRYRLAWLSARRRAAVESNYGAEAMDHMRGQAAQLTAQRDRLRAFADEVAHIRGWCMDAATAQDLLTSHLRPIYEALYELEGATREGRPFVPRLERRFPQVD